MAREYRQRAAELLRIAEIFKDRPSREEMITLAAEWEQLAQRAEARSKKHPKP